MDRFDRIRAVIAGALMVEPETVTRETNLIRDLGAESIDFLEIMFRLEREFGLKLPRGEIERRARGELTDAEFAPDGCLSEAALARLAVVMPEVPRSELARGLMARDIPRLMTAATFERIVQEQLGEALTTDARGVGRLARPPQLPLPEAMP